MKFNVFLLAATLLAASSCAVNCERTELFNGNDLTGWVCVLDPDAAVSSDEVFGVHEGNIRISGQPFGYMRTSEKYGDYKLHVEWRWVGEGTNSGIFHRVQDGDGIWPDAIECQLCSGKAGDFVMLGGATIDEVECVGPYPVKERAGDYENPAGEWNEAEIICKGNTITVYINGELQNKCTCRNSEGYIALQSEGGPIEFRNLYLVKEK